MAPDTFLANFQATSQTKNPRGRPVTQGEGDPRHPKSNRWAAKMTFERKKSKKLKKSRKKRKFRPDSDRIQNRFLVIFSDIFRVLVARNHLRRLSPGPLDLSKSFSGHFGVLFGKRSL